MTGATLTHVGIGTAASGAGYLIGSGALSTSYVVATPNAPNFPIGNLTVTAS